MRDHSSDVVSFGSSCKRCPADRFCWNSKERSKAKKSRDYREWFVPFLCKKLTIVTENFEIERLCGNSVRVLMRDTAIQASAAPFTLMRGFESLGHMYVNIRCDPGRLILGKPLRVSGPMYEYVHREEYDPIRNIGIMPCWFD